jgi:hypothetical protein
MVPSGAATCREHLLMLVFGEEMYKSLVAPSSMKLTQISLRVLGCVLTGIRWTFDTGN